VDGFDAVHDWTDQPIAWVTRNQVKVAICGKCQGVKDAHVLAGVQERFGGKDKCKGHEEGTWPVLRRERPRMAGAGGCGGMAGT